MELKPGCVITVEGPVMKITYSYLPSLDDCILGLDVTAEKYPSRLRMWVFAEGLKLDTEEIKAMSAHARSLFSYPSKLAIVSPTDLGYGYARMYEVYRGQDFIELMVFRSEEEAETWLLQGVAPV